MFGCIVWIKPLSLSFSIKNWIIQVLQKQTRTYFRTSISLSFTEFIWNLFIDFLYLANLILMNWHFWSADSHCLKHFSDTLTWVLFNNCFQILVINCVWMTSTLIIFTIRISTKEPLKPATFCSITNESFSPYSVDISSCLRSIMNELELLRKL